MKLIEFIDIDSILVDVNVDSKKNLFKLISNKFSNNNLEASSKIIEKLNERERLGSTGIGDGVAIPHSKVNLFDNTKVMFLKLKSAIDFSSSDNKNVDLVFAILAPKDCQSEHLLVLSSISSFLKKKSSLSKLRSLKKPSQIYNLLEKV